MAAVVAFATSAWIGFLTIQAARLHGIAIDQRGAAYKTHLHKVSRLGGIPVMTGISTALLLLAWEADRFESPSAFLIIALLPAFAIGVLEDVLQSLGSVVRLVFTMIAAALGWWLLDTRLTAIEIAAIDRFLAQSVWISFALTLFAVAGVAHAVNIIDGCNGLSSFVSMVALGGIALIAQRVGDDFVTSTALLGVCAMLGFFVWNYPLGRLFLGDGGAYVSGLLIALLSILLVRRNAEVSAWFPALLMAYPIWETLYSAFRRVVIQRRAAMRPDRLHLHNLVYHRLVRVHLGTGDAVQQSMRSAVASSYLWGLTLACALAAIAFWNDTGALQVCSALFALAYHLIYQRLVRFRAPRVLVLRESGSRHPAVPEGVTDTDRPTEL